LNIERGIIIILLCFFLAVLFSCSGAKNNLEANFTDEELFERGLKEFNDKNYQKARMYFNRIETYFPQSNYIQRARLLRADSHFKEGSYSGYIEAQAEYQTFLNLYPTANNLDYIQFQIAMCSYKQVGKPDRDNTATEKAYAEFKTFIEKYPNSELMDEAKKYFQDVSDRLAQHEFQIGYFYFKLKRYRAAVNRFSYSIKEYANSLLDGKLLYYLGKSYLELGNIQQAQSYLTQLVDKFPNSEFTNEAKELLSSISEKEIPPSRKP
jgi:outer membrane protein assembly factor BamD